MKRIYEELRIIRQQMEEDYMLHSERISAQNQSIERIDKAFARVQFDLRETRSVVSGLESGFGRMENRLTSLEGGFGKLESRLTKVESGFGKLESGFGKLESGFGKLESGFGKLQKDLATVQTDLATVKTDVTDLKTDVSGLKTEVSGLKTEVSGLKDETIDLRANTALLGQVLDRTGDSLSHLRNEFGEFVHHTGSYHQTWAMERKRNLRLFDVIQTSLLTSGIETEARLDRVEERVDRLEDGAA